jgi:hypothetical protein
LVQLSSHKLAKFLKDQQVAQAARTPKLTLSPAPANLHAAPRSFQRSNRAITLVALVRAPKQ